MDKVMSAVRLVEPDALAHSDNAGLFVSYTRATDCLAFSVKFSQLRQISHPLAPNTHILCLATEWSLP